MKVIEGDVYSTITLRNDLRKDRLFISPKAEPGEDRKVSGSKYHTKAYVALSERLLRHVVNDATHGGEENKVTVPAVTFGLGGKREEKEAYREAYRLGAEMVVFDMLYDMTQMHFGVLGSSYSVSPIFLFSTVIGLTEEQHSTPEYELRKAWTLDVGVVYRSISDAKRIPLGVLGIQVGLASLMLRDDFEFEEDKVMVKELLNRYSLLTSQQALLMLDAWNTSAEELQSHHEKGIYI